MLARGSERKTIGDVVKSGLCTGCGTCAGICPVHAVEMVIERKKGIYLPVLREDTCTRCGLCLEACPGQAVDFRQWNLDIFGREPDGPLIGNCLHSYVGHATDHDIRHNSSSGGLVTALLIHALEKHIIDGALVTRMNKEKPLEPEPFIARTREEIVSAAGSKYCPVPANTALREILETEGRYAVVGLPCHIHGIRKAETVIRHLEQKVVLRLGLFCNHVPSLWGTRLLLQKLRLSEDEVVTLGYRGEGWPGKMKISTRHGLVLLPDYWGFLGSHFFSPSRCLVCSDALNELADVAFGDAWLRELSDDRAGRSMIVVRNDKAKRTLRDLEANYKIVLTDMPERELIRSQAGVLYLKRKGAHARARRLGLMPRHNMPDRVLRPDVIDRLLSLFPYLNSCLGANPAVRSLLPRMPSELLRLYNMPYAVASAAKAKWDFRGLS